MASYWVPSTPSRVVRDGPFRYHSRRAVKEKSHAHEEGLSNSSPPRWQSARTLSDHPVATSDTNAHGAMTEPSMTEQSMLQRMTDLEARHDHSEFIQNRNVQELRESVRRLERCLEDRDANASKPVAIPGGKQAAVGIGPKRTAANLLPLGKRGESREGSLVQQDVPADASATTISRVNTSKCVALVQSNDWQERFNALFRREAETKALVLSLATLKVQLAKQQKIIEQQQVEIRGSVKSGRNSVIFADREYDDQVKMQQQHHMIEKLHKENTALRSLVAKERAVPAKPTVPTPTGPSHAAAADAAAAKRRVSVLTRQLSEASTTLKALRSENEKLKGLAAERFATNLELRRELDVVKSELQQAAQVGGVIASDESGEVDTTPCCTWTENIHGGVLTYQPSTTDVPPRPKSAMNTAPLYPSTPSFATAIILQPPVKLYEMTQQTTGKKRQASEELPAFTGKRSASGGLKPVDESGSEVAETQVEAIAGARDTGDA